MRNFLLIAGIAFLNPLFSFSQVGGISANKMAQIHHETVEDKYLPNAFNNKKTSPAYKFKSNTSRLMNATVVFTIQVNVNGTGENILGDAGNEPNIAINPVNPNQIVIGWRQFDNVTSNFRQAGWSYSSDAGQHWTFPGVIQPGVFRSDPVLDYDKNGNIYYNSLSSVSNTFPCKVFKSTNGGVTWGAAIDAKGGDKQWMTIDRTSGVGSGNIYASWTQQYSICMPGFFTRSTTGGGSFESCTSESGDSYWKMLAVGNSGELYIAGADTTNSNMIVAKSLNAQTPGSIISWNTPVSVFMDGTLYAGETINPSGLLGQANIDVDRSSGPGRGNVYVLASVKRISNTDPGDVIFARSTDGGLTWSAPIKINDDATVLNTQWLATMSVAPNGRIDVAWLDTRDGSGSEMSALYYSYSIDQGTTWSANEKLSDIFDPHVGYPNQSKMGDYFDMISDNAGAHLAWTNTLNGEEDVYYSHIMPQFGVGVNEVSENAFSIFPNPTNGSFVIISEALPSQIEIYNTLGEKIYSRTTSKMTNEIDLSAEPAGVYVLKIINEDGSSEVKKIIRE